MTDPVRPLVIGVGNRSRGDDALGPVVADIVAERWPDRVDTAVVEGDLSTLPLLWSADRPVVVVDAAVVNHGASIEPGTMIEFDGLGRDWPIGGHGPPLSTHGIGLATAVELARRLNRLPDSLTVLAVVVPGRLFHHQAALSRQLQRRRGAIVSRIGEILNLTDRSPTLGGGDTAGGSMNESDEFDRERRVMIRTQIMARGVRDERVLAAIEHVPRHRFVETTMVEQAYEDHPLPIGLGQTISQPFMVAFMAEAAELEPGDRVLEIGTGSGYGAAVLGCLAGEVWTIERHHELVALAKAHLADATMKGEFDHVHVIEGDGTKGLPDRAPFDAIVVTAAARRVPDALVDQLADGGRLIVPVGRSSRDQMLIRLRRSGDRVEREDLGAVRFVPLVADGKS